MRALPESSGLNERGETFFIQMVLRRFFDKADEDYIATRVLYLSALSSWFWWANQQTLEKYLKSALLLRCQPIKKDHNIKALFKSLKDCADVNFPGTIEVPDDFSPLPRQIAPNGKVKDWPFREEISQFVSKVAMNGGPASRYNETDLFVEPYDLIKFDFVSKLFRDCSLETPNLILHRGVVQEFENGVASCKFGRTKARGGAFDNLKKYNYAYFPNQQHLAPYEHMEMKNNLGKGKIYKNDNDYREANIFLESLIESQKS